jgi:hypothetical protein
MKYGRRRALRGRARNPTATMIAAILPASARKTAGGDQWGAGAIAA